jgi:hypothetical protein
MICPRCGSSVLALVKGICTSCTAIQLEKEKKKQEKLKAKPKRKPKNSKKKSKHNLEQHILIFLQYIANHPELITLQKIEITTLMGIPRTATNYLIVVLKQRGFVVTVGEVGKQKYKPIRLFRECIAARVENLRRVIRLQQQYGDGIYEIQFIPKTKPTSYGKNKKKRSHLFELCIEQEEKE